MRQPALDNGRYQRQPSWLGPSHMSPDLPQIPPQLRIHQSPMHLSWTFQALFGPVPDLLLLLMKMPKHDSLVLLGAIDLSCTLNHAFPCHPLEHSFKYQKTPKPRQLKTLPWRAQNPRGKYNRTQYFKQFEQKCIML